MTFAVHPKNHRCFVFRDQPFRILSSAEHYGAVLNGDFDFDAYLREMHRTGQNHTRVFTFYRELESSISPPGRMNTLAPRPEASVLPWSRAADAASAADGLPKFDLDRWNDAYFRRLKDYVAQCGSAGVVCELVLFCNPYAQDIYDWFPCSPASNVNGVGADLRQRGDFMALKAPSTMDFQERFVRKVVAELNAFDNVYYEVCNEPQGDEDEVVAWHAHIARVVRETESSLPKRHLIAVNPHAQRPVAERDGRRIVRHEEERYLADPNVDVINYHYISAKEPDEGLAFVRGAATAGATWRFLRRRDGFRKPLVFDETFSGVVRGEPERYTVNRAEAWEMLLSGGAGYSNLDWTFLPGNEQGDGARAISDGRRLDGRRYREWLGVLRDILAAGDLASLVPAVGLLPDRVPGVGYAASTDGAGRYLLYLVNEDVYRLRACGSVSPVLHLSLPPGDYAVRTVDPVTGALATRPDIPSDGRAALGPCEFCEDVALVLERHES
jgi:hypothetical protein